MKKILIMIMSCEQDFFIKQEEDCRNTYLSNLPDNIDFIIYRGNNKNGWNDYNPKTKLLLLNCEDDLNNTYRKTYKAFEAINNYLEKDYDYIFRTNTSTYINIPLLNSFVQSLPNDNNNVYSGEIIYDCRPNKTIEVLYGRGNSLLLSKKQIQIILDKGQQLFYFRNLIIDDSAIGIIFAEYYESKNDPYYNHIKCFTEGWYKSLPKDNDYSEHQVCKMNNDNTDFNFLKKMVIIQIKSYIDRNQEHESYQIIHKVFSENIDTDIDNTVKYLYEYMKNPDVFIGDCYGYKQLKELL